MKRYYKKSIHGQNTLIAVCFYGFIRYYVFQNREMISLLENYSKNELLSHCIYSWDDNNHENPLKNRLLIPYQLIKINFNL